MSFNLSALAVRERAVTLFLIVAIVVAGTFAFFKLGRAEDPSFTIKVMTVVTAWPGATAQEMQDQVAEPLEKRLQELKWYDRTETFTRPGLAFTTLTLKDPIPPKEVQEEFYQARKKLGDEAANLPQGVLGPFVNDEYGDVTFALYALKAKGEPHRQLVREAETLRQRLLHVPGVKKVNIIGERPERIFVEFSQARLSNLGVSPRDIFAALNNRNLVTPAGSIETNGPQVQVRLDGALDDLEKIKATPIVVGGKTLQAVRHRRRQARLRGSGDLPDPQRRRARPGARGGDEGALQRPATGQGPRQGGQGHRVGAAPGPDLHQGHRPGGQHHRGL
jgi:multidrug efflux pump subunit AcrB